MAQRECTETEAQQWRDRYTDGYQAGRGDARFSRGPRIPLIQIPAEVPFESGAAYVARNVAQAWEIGYARAYRFATAH